MKFQGKIILTKFQKKKKKLILNVIRSFEQQNSFQFLNPRQKKNTQMLTPKENRFPLLYIPRTDSYRLVNEFDLAIETSESGLQGEKSEQTLFNGSCHFRIFVDFFFVWHVFWFKFSLIFCAPFRNNI